MMATILRLLPSNRTVISSTYLSSIARFKRLTLHSSASQPTSKFPAITSPSKSILSPAKSYSTALTLNSNSQFFRSYTSSPEPTPNINTKVNFSLPSDSEDEESSNEPGAKKEIDKSKSPPLYDPFDKNKTVIEEPEDPRNLQEIFHKMRTDGVINNAAKMFDALSKDGLTHEALELFSQMKDSGNMPDVVSYTAVIEVYVNAGQSKEALKTFLRMLASGVLPNAYTYSILITGLAKGDGKFLEDVKKYVKEMMGKGMKVNAGTSVPVFEGFVREGIVEEGREFLKEMKESGFTVDEDGVREVLKGKRGPMVRKVMDILLGK